MSILIKKSAVFIFLFAVLLSACDSSCDGNDCEEDAKILQPVSFYVFINNDSLAFHDSVKVELDSRLDSLENKNSEFQDSVFFLLDSLNALNTGIDSGNTSLIPLREEVEQTIISLNSITDQLEEDISETNINIRSNNSVISIINSGKILVSEIKNLNNDRSLFYEDSIQVYTLPYEMNGNSIDYEFIIDQKSYALSLIYILRETLNERNEFRLAIDSIEINSIQNFDSVTYDENTFTCYF